MNKIERECCFLHDDFENCTREVEWAIRPASHPYKIIYGCDKHLSDLLDITVTNEVWYIGEQSNEES